MNLDLEDLVAITYIGRGPGFMHNEKQRGSWEFEWQKSIGIGGRKGEVPKDVAIKLAKMKNRRGKNLFIIDRLIKEEVR